MLASYSFSLAKCLSYLRERKKGKYAENWPLRHGYLEQTTRDQGEGDRGTGQNKLKKWAKEHIWIAQEHRPQCGPRWRGGKEGRAGTWWRWIKIAGMRTSVIVSTINIKKKEKKNWSLKLENNLACLRLDSLFCIEPELILLITIKEVQSQGVQQTSRCFWVLKS